MGARSRRGLSITRVVFAALLLAFSFPRGIAAQVTDTARVDTVAVPQDTAAVPQDTTGAAQDSVAPPALMPAFPPPRPTDWVAGRWHWDQNALLNEGVLTLGELLERIPGLHVLRLGMFVQPEAPSLFGGTGPRIEIELDGFVLDPLAAGLLDVSRLELAQLTSIEVIRRPDLVRIRLSSIQPTDARAYSRIEAGIGEPDANLFRGMLLGPRVLIGPFGFAVERLDSDGLGGSEPADRFSTWLKWGWTSETRGIQLELRNASADREPESPWIGSHSRVDLMLRARNAFAPGIVAEAFVGRSSISEEPVDTSSSGLPQEDTVPELERDSWQFGARAAYDRAPVRIVGSVRSRSGQDQLPSLQADVDAEAELFGYGRVAGSITQSNWDSGSKAFGWYAHGEVGPFYGLRAFAEVTGGRRGVPVYDSLAPLPHAIEARDTRRIGGEFTLGRLRAGGALLRVQTDSFPAFGLPFDSSFTWFTGGSATGWEVSASVPLYFDWLTLEGDLTRWTGGDLWAYLPEESGRAALVIHSIPLESGNFEILARGEMMRHGAMLAPNFPLDPADPALGVAPPRTILNGYLMIRIHSVRIFGRLEDVTGANAEFLPARSIRGPRLVYGVKWYFWN